ncbi:hypothetical protein E8E13_004356 [Curvularia kusanoi]|uniref:Oxidoreductase family protein n=1 Tax=Curvularia kusanoi TaxID=90978 RepID=A0A9P4T6Q6_CURKU|nr:hypothetical protein E8E13_004356 [Curvularia kusanoi]
MAPIRVALVGLSASAKVTWAADAHLPYLFSPRGKRHYQLVALLNSSTEAAESAKKTFDLPSDIKAYADPAKLAADPDIDLVVVNTRVDVHFAVAEPSLRAGKGIFIEWPLVENLEKGIELTGGQAYPDSIIGLQGRVAPLTLRLKETLASGTIGKVLSSEVRAYGNLVPRNSLSEGLTYFADRKVGGHPLNIHYGHLIDYVHEVLGNWQDFHAVGQIQRPVLSVVGTDGQKGGDVQSDVPDYVSVHGTLQNNKGVFKGEPGLVWTVSGENGELKLSAPGPYLMSGDSFDGPITIEHHDYASDEVIELGWDWLEWQQEYGLRARSTAELYERYAEWVESGRPANVPEERQWPRLQDGLALLEEFDKLYKQIDPQWYG